MDDWELQTRRKLEEVHRCLDQICDGRFHQKWLGTSEGDRSTHDQPHLLGTLPRQSKFELELMNVDELKEKRYSRLGHKAFVSQQIACYMCFTSTP